ncbi:hypothetical protein BJX99DRAFT_260149 [Aspergillus californicus]
MTEANEQVLLVSPPVNYNEAEHATTSGPLPYNPSNRIGSNSPQRVAASSRAEDIQILEERLSKLERRAYLLDGGNKDDDSNDDTGGDEGSVNTIPDLFRASWLGFKNRFTGNDTHAVETLTWKSFSHTTSDDDTQTDLENSLFYKKALRHYQTHKASSVGLKTVDFIRINSDVILRSLHEVEPEIPIDGVPLVICAPFALLIHCHEQIKRSVDLLQQGATSMVEESDDTAELHKDLSDTEETLSHMACYMQLMDNEIMPLYHRLGCSTADTKVRFCDLAYLFRLDDDLYYPDGDKNLQQRTLHHQTIWRVVPEVGVMWCIISHRKPADSPSHIKLRCYSIDFDGNSYVPVERVFQITHYEGERDVTSLEIYPLRFAPDAAEIVRESKLKGQKFIRCIRQKQLSYQGWALQSPDVKNDRRYISSNVIIDCAETFKEHPDWKARSTHALNNVFNISKAYPIARWRKESHSQKAYREHDDHWYSEKFLPYEESETYLQKQGFVINHVKRQNQKSRNQGAEKAIQEHDLILLPKRVFAYSLQDRRFVAADLDYLNPLENVEDPFKDLVISPRYKSMLSSLVYSHFDKKRMEQLHGFSNTGQDIIHDKGRGLVILLHGVPGVGKTSTAEAVAQSRQKPLLAITCGDLGLEAYDVEDSLKKIFHFAQLWDCVVLLDEAEVFLSERSPSDLQRNSLVSVFLRVLEYYSGILFLTTNRVGNIDDAFKSRIHISLYFPPLGLRQTQKIWEMNIARLELIQEERSKLTGEPKLTIASSEILKFASDHFNRNSASARWNGRQIRNAFLTAAALARFEWLDKKVDTSTHDIRVEHFEAVAKAGWGFDSDLSEEKERSDEKLHIEDEELQQPAKMYRETGEPSPRGYEGSDGHQDMTLSLNRGPATAALDLGTSAYTPDTRQDDVSRQLQG